MQGTLFIEELFYWISEDQVPSVPICEVPRYGRCDNDNDLVLGAMKQSSVFNIHCCGCEPDGRSHSRQEVAHSPGCRQPRRISTAPWMGLRTTTGS